MKLDPRLLAAIRELLEVPKDSKDPAISWLAEAVMIALEPTGMSLEQALDDEFPSYVLDRLEEAKNTPTKAVREALRRRLKEFEAAGGRGVELADRIDSLSMVLNIRRKMHDRYSWPGPREWSPE